MTMAPSTSGSAASAPERNAKYPPQQGDWTYDDYARFTPDDGYRHGFKYEVIEGRLYMSPSPATKHQMILNELNFHITRHIKEHHLGQVLTAPMDVILGDDATPVEPDLIVILKEHRGIIKEKFIQGPPDLLVEVLSPSTARVDRQIKQRVFAQQGVREYWIVDPTDESIEVYVLRDDAYACVGRHERGPSGQTITSEVLPGLKLSVDEVFA